MHADNDRSEYDKIRAELAQEASNTTAPQVQRRAMYAPPLASFTRERVGWLWPGRLPLGMITVLDGDPGLGKSLLTLDIAARVSRGDVMPDGTKGDIQGPAGVVLMSVEDDPKNTIGPRADVAGADSARIAMGRCIIEPPAKADEPARQRGIRLNDIDELHEVILAYGAKLVIIDPLMSFMTGDAHRDQDVRQVLTPLSDLAADTGATMLVVRHLNKTGGSNALYRGGGSIGIIGAARVGLLVAKDPDDATKRRRVLAVTKSNLATDETPALAYHVENDDGVARLVWDGESEHDQSTLLSSNGDGDKPRPVDEAEAFLKGLLADGPMPSTRALEKAAEHGFSERTLARARSKLGVRSSPTGYGGPRRWRLPDKHQATSVCQSSQAAEEVAHTAKTDETGQAVEATEATDALPESVQLALGTLGGTVTSIRRTASCDHQ